MSFDAKEWIKQKFDCRNAGQYEIAVCCPMCSDSRYRLYICLDPNKKDKTGNLYPCWCHNDQERYSLAEIYSIVENVHINKAKEIVEGKSEEASYGELDEIYDVLMGNKESKEEVIEYKTLSFPHNYIPLHSTSKEIWNLRVPKYAVSRNVTWDMCQTYKLGFTKNGNLPWDNRLIIPIYMDKTLITYQGRKMADVKSYKYLFQKIQNTNYDIGDCLYEFDSLDFRNKDLILVEGVFDVWAVKKAGYNNCTASFGKHLTENALNRIIKNFDNLYIFWDEDAKKDIGKLIDRLFGYINISVCSLKHKDPDSSTIEEIKNSIINSKTYSDSYEYDSIIDMLS